MDDLARDQARVPAVPFGLRPPADDLPLLYGQAPVVAPVVVEPPLPAAVAPPIVRDWSGTWARADLRRYARCLQLDGHDLGEIAVGVTLDGQPVTVPDMVALLQERDQEPSPDAVRIAPPAPATAWPTPESERLARQLRQALDVPGIVGAPRLRELARALDAALGAT